MVEANPISFSRLVTQRPRTWRAETALCAEAGEIVFAGEGCCSTAVALRESTRAPATAYAVRCTPISALLKATGFDAIDFWSLDTEGSELDVLRGMDWSVPVSVILVESRNPKIHELLTDKGFERHRPRRPLKDFSVLRMMAPALGTPPARAFPVARATQDRIHDRSIDMSWTVSHYSSRAATGAFCW